MARTASALKQTFNRMVGSRRTEKKRTDDETNATAGHVAHAKQQGSNSAGQAVGGEGTLISGKELLVEKKAVSKMPTTLSEVDMAGMSDQERKSLVAEIRREYQRQYYQKHKEKAKEYQRQYNLTHKKKARGGRGKASFECQREGVRSTYNTADLMHSSVEKTFKMLDKIVKGERFFTM